MKIGSCELVRAIQRVVERCLCHVEWVEYQLTQQRLPTPTGAQLFDHVTDQRIDDVVVERLRPEVGRRVHVSDDSAPTEQRQTGSELLSTSTTNHESKFQ